MIFRITHVDVQRHRRRAMVTACNVDDCIDQVERELGAHIGLSVVRVKTKPVLHLCPTPAHFAGRQRHA